MKFPTVTSFGKDNRYINSYCKLLFLSTYFTALHRQIRQLVNQIDHWMVRYFPIITSIPSNNKTRKKDRKNTTYALDGWMVRNAPFVCGIGSVCQHDTLFSKSTGIHQDDFTPNAVLQTLNRHFAFACVPRKDIEDLEKAIKKITPIQEFKFVVDALENCPPAGKDELIRLGTVLMQLVSVGRKVLDAYDLAVALQPLLPSASLVAIPDSGHVFTP